jgi:type IV secretion system protein VirD4
MSDFPRNNVKWDSDQGLDAASALNGEHLVLGRPVVLDESFPNYLEPVDGRYFAVAPTKHLLTIGPTRSGKGVSLVIPNLLTYSGPAVVVDIGGESAWVTAERRRKGGGKVVIVDPFGAVNRRYGASAGVNETVARFNPLSNLEPGSGNYVDDVEDLAHLLIVNRGGDPHWDERARELVAGLIGLTMEVPEYRPGASLGLLRELLCQPNDVLFSVAARAVALGGASLAARKLVGFQTGSVEVAAVISEARTQTAFLDSRDLVENLSASDFSFDELLSANATVYLVLPPHVVNTYSRWLRLMLSMAIRAVARGWVGASGQLPVLFMLDDLGDVGTVDAVESTFMLMRASGVLLWAFVQDLPQLRSAYPKNWETLFGNVQATSLMGMGDRETESYISKLAGGGTTGAQAKVLAEEIRGRRPELCVMVRPGGPLLCRRIDYFKDDPFSSAARPNPLYKAGGESGSV